MTISLRPLQQSDLPMLLELETDSQTMFYTGSPEPKTPEQIQHNLDQLLAGFEPLPKFLKLAAEHPNHGVVGIVVCYIGDSGQGEIGYMMRRRLWGQGLGHQLAAAAFELGKQQFPQQPLVAYVYQDNVASWKCLLKLGFTISKRFHCDKRDLADMKLEWHGHRY